MAKSAATPNGPAYPNPSTPGFDGSNADGTPNESDILRQPDTSVASVASDTSVASAADTSAKAPAAVDTPPVDPETPPIDFAPQE